MPRPPPSLDGGGGDGTAISRVPSRAAWSSRMVSSCARSCAAQRRNLTESRHDASALLRSRIREREQHAAAATPRSRRKALKGTVPTLLTLGVPAPTPAMMAVGETKALSSAADSGAAASGTGGIRDGNGGGWGWGWAAISASRDVVGLVAEAVPSLSAPTSASCCSCSSLALHRDSFALRSADSALSAAAVIACSIPPICSCKTWLAPSWPRPRPCSTWPCST